MALNATPQYASALRLFIAILALGSVIVIGVWISVRVSARGVSSPVGDSNPQELSQQELSELRDAVGRAAGYVVLLYGAIGVPITAMVIALGHFRRTQELEQLADKVAWLASADLQEPLDVPAERSPMMYRIYQHMVDAQEAIRRRLQSLDAERRRGFQVLGHMTDGVLAVSADRRVVLLNPAAIRLLGLLRQSLLGRRLAEVVRIPQIVAAVDKVLAGGGPEYVEFDLPSDKARTLRLQAIELPSEGNSGVLVTIRDETQVKHLERMRREFIANVSHELKTPLAAVRGYAETLQLGAKEDPETCTHFLQQIDVQSLRLERLINDMLQLARAQTGSENLILGSVPLGPVLNESVLTYEPIAKARQLSMEYQPPPDGATVFVDREALLTIANNLLGNAVRYTPEGGYVKLSVRDELNRWLISVSDDGLGIPLADQERIFERFYRVEKARDATRGGTGLGLAIVKNLVSALAGEVRLSSTPGVGSTFEVLLPKAVAGSQQQLSPSP